MIILALWTKYYRLEMKMLIELFEFHVEIPLLWSSTIKENYGLSEKEHMDDLVMATIKMLKNQRSLNSFLMLLKFLQDADIVQLWQKMELFIPGASIFMSNLA